MNEDIKRESEAAEKSFFDVLNIAKAYPICCISAITDMNRNDPDKRSYDTKRLEADIALHYNYIPVLVRWVEPVGGETTEESYIVIGYDYDYENSDSFRHYMTYLCDKYDQRTVLVIEKAFDNDISSDMDDLRLHHIHALKYDSNGNIAAEFKDISPKQIEDYYTQLVPDSKFTLMADQIVRPGFYSNPSTVWAYEHIMTSDQRISSLDRFKKSGDYSEKASVFEKKYFG